MNISMVEHDQLERYVLAGVPIEKARQYAREDAAADRTIRHEGGITDKGPAVLAAHTDSTDGEQQ